jgi:C-terminal processing protease CtpA/Prc
MLRISSLVVFCFFTVSALAQVADPAIGDLLQQAYAAYGAKHFNESSTLYARAVPLVQDDDRAGVEYNLACSQALAGNRALALETLGRAVEDGYFNRRQVETDTDLISLHSDSHWQALLERMIVLARQQDSQWGASAFATPNAASLSDADKLAGLAELWAQAKFGFANFWHVPQLNWDQSYRDFIPQVLATRSTDEYIRVLERFYALLQDGHSAVYTSEWAEGVIHRLPLLTRLVDGHLLVMGSRDLGVDLKGLHLGDEIVTINSEPATSWAQRNVVPFVSASSAQGRNAVAYDYDIFNAPIGTIFQLGIQTPSGQRSTLLCTVTKTTEPYRPEFELKFLPGNIAYVALNSFGNDTAANEWNRHWPEIGKASALILDLRENGGGDSSVGYRILATLLDRPTPGELERSTRWIATYRSWGRAEMPLRLPIVSVDPDPARHFSGPTVLLISPRTASAAEDTAVVFTQAHRGKIIGEPSAGTTGQPLIFKLPAGAMARVCTKHDSFADGREFIGVGIQPDIPVHITRDDILSGRDPVLETAIHSLQ